MQPYSYRDSGIEWLGKIPTHWRVQQLKRVARLVYGGNLPAESRVNGDISVYGSNGIVDSHDEAITSGATIIIGRKGSAGAINYSPTSCFPIDTAFYIDESKSYPDIRWLFYVLSDLGLDNLQTDSPVPGLPREIAERKCICHPLLTEQRAIAGFLDEACGKIDAAIQVKREQVAMLDVMAKAILNKAILEGLNPDVSKQTINNIWFKTLPAHWQLRRLKDVSTMQTGVTLGKDYDGETDERPYLRVANVQDGHLALDDMKTIKLPPHLIRRYELQDGDVLMNEGGDLDKLGRGHVWHNEIPGCLHQNHVFALRCFPHKLLPDYLTLLTSSTHGRAYFEIMGKKTTNLASINSTKVNLFPVPLPPVTEQAEIVQWVQYERGKLKQAQDAVNAQISVLEAYKKSLVHECVTGKKQVWRGG